MTNISRLLSCAAILFAVHWAGAFALEDAKEIAAQAERRVAEMIRDVDTLSARTDLSDAVLAKRFAGIMAQHADRSYMARASLGEASKRLTRDQRERYLAAFSTHLDLSFVRGVRELGASTTRLLGSRIAPDGTIYVITRGTVDEIEEDAFWMMCRSDPQKVCDVEVAGTTASSHYRSSFADRLRVKGLDDLIRALESGWMVETR